MSTSTPRAPAPDSRRSTRALIDLDAIAGNVRYFRQLVSDGTALVAVVKADGYGHGAVPVSRVAMEAGASCLAVATVDEGIDLRDAGLDAPILVLGPFDLEEARAALERRLTLTLTDRRSAVCVIRTAEELGGHPATVHIKVNTGMHRFGAEPDEAVSLAEMIDSTPSLTLGGVYTHFADADGQSVDTTRGQAVKFQEVLQELAARGVSPGMAHASNSAATLRWRDYDFDAVRIGIAMYGLPPTNTWVLPSSLRPAMRVISRIAKVSTLREGMGVSYGLTYRASQDELIGLAPIGYADGLPRALSNRGWMGCGQVRLPIRGRVCMDQTVVGLPWASAIRVGDEVEVMGGDGTCGPSLAQVAELSATIAYEIAVGVGKRVPRDYVRSSASVNR